MGFMDKVKDFITPVDENDEDDYEAEEDEYTPAPVKTAAAATAAQAQQPVYENSNTNKAAPLDAKTKMVLFEPRSYGEAEAVGGRLKEGRAVVVNLHKLDREYAQRTIDFLSGVVFALDGNIQKIGQNVILCYPNEIGVAGSISLGAEEPVAPTADPVEE